MEEAMVLKEVMETPTKMEAVESSAVWSRQSQTQRSRQMLLKSSARQWLKGTAIQPPPRLLLVLVVSPQVSLRKTAVMAAMATVGRGRTLDLTLVSALAPTPVLVPGRTTAAVVARMHRQSVLEHRPVRSLQSTVPLTPQAQLSALSSMDRLWYPAARLLLSMAPSSLFLPRQTP
jgi:hypothetical protein